MSFYNGILNLTNWGGNVILPTLAGLFIAIAIIQFSKGAAYQHAMYGGFLCLMASGLLRAFETFASQRSWNSPDLVWAGSPAWWTGFAMCFCRSMRGCKWPRAVCNWRE